tara:strand:- start:9 stop:353 length:345 start_codon:yes stop_codon:yes gene_type:complete
MWWILVILSLFLSVIFNYFFYTHKKLKELKAFIYKLFWAKEIANPENKHKFAFKFMNFGVRFFMYPYIFFVSFFFIYGIMTADFTAVLFSILMAIIWPIGYRIIMGFQRKIHGI